MPQVTIRLAREEDDEAVGELLIRAFVETYARKMPEVIVTESRKADLRDVSSKRAVAQVWIAERSDSTDNRIVGTVALFPAGSAASQAWLPNCSDLRHLAISDEARGLGISTQLVSECERQARVWGNSAICLHVRQGADGVGKTYESLGYDRDLKGDASLSSVHLLGYIKYL